MPRGLEDADSASKNGPTAPLSIGICDSFILVDACSKEAFGEGRMMACVARVNPRAIRIHRICPSLEWLPVPRVTTKASGPSMGTSVELNCSSCMKASRMEEETDVGIRRIYSCLRLSGFPDTEFPWRLTLSCSSRSPRSSPAGEPALRRRFGRFSRECTSCASTRPPAVRPSGRRPVTGRSSDGRAQPSPIQRAQAVQTLGLVNASTFPRPHRTT